VNAKRLRAADLEPWLRSLMDAQIRVVGPVRSPAPSSPLPPSRGKGPGDGGGATTLFATLRTPGDLILDENLPRKSAKGVFFPQSEVILHMHLDKGSVRVEDVDGFAPPTVLLGVHPCDAAALGILDSVFSWDYKDTFYLRRRENTTIVTLGCAGPIDDSCFCTSVGLGPDSRDGADVYMVKDPSGDLVLEPVTEKGEALLARSAPLLEDAEPLAPSGSAGDVPERFDLETIKPWLDDHFTDDFWREMSLRCIGCGTCSFLCPTCHCFDIVDEMRLGEGVRRRNWDSCQFGLFTLHASGHNPRSVQSERCRQRIMHKFKYYVEKFDKVLCVGCGRCVRACPVGQSLLDYLTEIERRSRLESTAPRTSDGSV
jgi:ferredoxin